MMTPDAVRAIIAEVDPKPIDLTPNLSHLSLHMVIGSGVNMAAIRMSADSDTVRLGWMRQGHAGSREFTEPLELLVYLKEHVAR